MCSATDILCGERSPRYAAPRSDRGPQARHGKRRSEPLAGSRIHKFRTGERPAAPFEAGRKGYRRGNSCVRFSLTWGGSGQAHSFAPAAGVSPVKRGEAQRSRERSDLDAPAAGYTVASERALARSWLPLWSLLRSFILALRISFCVWIRSVSPSFACSLDGRITSHPVELVGSDHNPSCSRASGSGWRDHSVNRRVSAREFRGHRPPGSGEAAFSFAGVGGVG